MESGNKNYLEELEKNALYLKKGEFGKMLLELCNEIT